MEQSAICIIAVIITEYMYGKCMHRVGSYRNTEYLRNKQHPWVYWKIYLQSSETVVVESSVSQGRKNKNLASSANSGFALAHLRRGCEQVPLEQVTAGPAEEQSHSGLGQNCVCVSLCSCFL